MNAADLDTRALWNSLTKANEPPHSTEAEQSTLGGLLLDCKAFPRVRDVLTEGAFYLESHRAIWRAFERVHHEDEAADLLTVCEQLRVDGALESVGGLAYLQSLVSATPSAANVGHYAGIVARLAKQRRLAGHFEELRAAALTPGADTAQLRATAELMLAGIEHAKPLQPIDLADLATRDPHPPKSIMAGMPTGYAMLLAGHGGAGKSQIALMLLVCLAAGIPFFGLEIAQRSRVLLLSCEDRADVLHWRLSRICAFLGIDMGELRGWLEIVDLVGRDSILWRADTRGPGAVTPAFHQVADLMRRGATDVLMVDGISDTFGGNENDKGHVKQFVNALLGLVPADSGALVLIGHVAKATAGGFSTEGYSGSAGWHNAVRARWYLYPETRPGDDGERNERTGSMLLELQKANHGHGGTTMRFEWDEAAHLFVGQLEGGMSNFDRSHQDRTERAGILRAFKACAEASPPVAVPAAMTGPRTALHVLAARPEFPESLRAGKPAARRFWRHVEELRHLLALSECSIRRSNRHLLACLEITPEGMRQCAE